METLGVKSQLNRRKDSSDQILMTEVIWTQWQSRKYRNTPDRDTRLSHAKMLYGRHLRDFLPSKPDKFCRPNYDNLRKEWKDTAEWREKALAKRGTKIIKKLSEHTKELPDLSVGDHVIIQNQLGNNSIRPVQ